MIHRKQTNKPIPILSFTPNAIEARKNLTMPGEFDSAFTLFFYQLIVQEFILNIGNFIFS